MALSDAPQWNRQGRDWPNRDASRFVTDGGVRWHVQVMGEGPVVLLLHGAGAATHSWRDLAPRLAQHAGVVLGHRDHLGVLVAIRRLGDFVGLPQLFFSEY